MIKFDDMTDKLAAKGFMRTFDATIVNQIVNENPEIARAVFAPEDGSFDFQDHLGALESFALLSNGVDGCSIFEWSSPTVWQAHTVFGPTCRGKRAIEDAKRMILEMFVVWGAEELWGMTPIDNRAAHIFNRKVGAEYHGQGEHHHTGTGLYFRIKRDSWLEKHG